MRTLLLLPLAACASWAPIRPCQPGTMPIDPAYVSFGNDDLMVASVRWFGCEDYDFGLCGVGPAWFTEDAIHLSLFHDGSMSACGNDVQIDDQLFDFSDLRHRYETAFDVEAATVPLRIGSHELQFSFQPDED